MLKLTLLTYVLARSSTSCLVRTGKQVGPQLRSMPTYITTYYPSNPYYRIVLTTKSIMVAIPINYLTVKQTALTNGHKF